jgi:hypothetical protein
MQRSSYSGLRTNRGFLHANPATFTYELPPLPNPADLFTSTAILPRIFIRGNELSKIMGAFTSSSKFFLAPPARSVNTVETGELPGRDSGKLRLE